MYTDIGARRGADGASSKVLMRGDQVQPAPELGQAALLGPDHDAADLIIGSAEPGFDVVDKEAAINIAVLRKLGRILDDGHKR